MDDDSTLVESTEGQQTAVEGSSDVRGAIEAAMKEVSERARDDQGRFAKPTETPAASTAKPTDQAAPAAAVAKPAGEVGQVQQGQTEVQPAPIKPPDAWSPAAKAKFATLDLDIQQEVMRREAEVHKGFTTQDEHRKVGKTFNDAMAPYLPMIRAEGGDPITAVQNLMQTAYNLRAGNQAQKQEMAIALCQQYGIDLNGIFQRLQGGQQQVHPQVAQLQQQLAQLQQERQQQTSTAQAQEQAQLNQTIESFASDPKNVYFANVKPEMAALLRDGRAKDLQEAYDMACWARPDIRPLMLQQTEQQKQAAARAQTQKARVAGASISGSPTGSAGNGAPATRSLREELAANLHEVMSRS